MVDALESNHLKVLERAQSTESCCKDQLKSVEGWPIEAHVLVPSTSYVSSVVCHRIAVLVAQVQMLELGETRKAMIHLTRLCSTPLKHFERPPFIFGKFGLTETMTRSTRSSSLSLSLFTHPSGGSASRASCRPTAITAYRQPNKTLNAVKHS